VTTEVCGSIFRRDPFPDLHLKNLVPVLVRF
jgi:hypothetical protein